MESAAFKKLTEQLTEIVQYVRLAKMAFQENLTGKGLKPMLTNDDAAKMLGVSKRTLQRMRSENRIDFIKIIKNSFSNGFKCFAIKSFLSGEYLTIR